MTFDAGEHIHFTRQEFAERRSRLLDEIQRRRLDAVLEPFLLREPPLPVRHILWLGAAASLYLNAPAHAVVATAVDLARARKLAPFAGLINAVLRKVVAAGPAAHRWK